LRIRKTDLGLKGDILICSISQENRTISTTKHSSGKMERKHKISKREI
jgi:hypothetical protein